MREVSSFVVVFPSRLAVEPIEKKRAILDALRRNYPHYSFQAMEGRAFEDEDEFGIIPVMGRAGDETSDPDQVYMCKPLDPRVIPDLTHCLRALELTSTLVN